MSIATYLNNYGTNSRRQKKNKIHYFFYFFRHSFCPFPDKFFDQTMFKFTAKQKYSSQ